MTKAEEKRAAIIAQQVARELADATTRPASAGTAGGGPGRGGKKFAARPPFSDRRRGRPPKT